MSNVSAGGWLFAFTEVVIYSVLYKTIRAEMDGFGKKKKKKGSSISCLE